MNSDLNSLVSISKGIFFFFFFLLKRKYFVFKEADSGKISLMQGKKCPEKCRKGSADFHQDFFYINILYNWRIENMPRNFQIIKKNFKMGEEEL